VLRSFACHFSEIVNAAFASNPAATRHVGARDGFFRSQARVMYQNLGSSLSSFLPPTLDILLEPTSADHDFEPLKPRFR
jgi:hypothetical protein